MPETFTVTAVKAAGEKKNPHGGTLYKFYVNLTDESGANLGDIYNNKGVYWQRKSQDLAVGEQVYGHIEDGEYGPRFKTDQRPDGSGPPAQQGNSQSRQQGMSKDDYWRNKDQRDIEGIARMGRAHAQEMSLRYLTLRGLENITEPELKKAIREWTDFFENDVDVGGGEGSSSKGPSESAAADVSAEKTSGEPQPDNGPSGLSAGREGATPLSQSASAPSPEASPQQKGRLTSEFNKAGFSREARMAVVLYRCHSEKATKQGASQLIDDLQGGATLEQLLAEIWDGKRAGNPLAIRAAALIPSETGQWTDDGGLPPAEPQPEEEGGVPF